MAVVLNPATLKFSNDELELSYAKYRNSRALLTSEKNFLLLTGVLYFFFVASEFVPPENWNINTAFLLKLLGVSIAAIHGGAMLWCPTEVWVQNRFMLVTVFRSVRLLVFLLSVQHWVTESPTPDAKALFKIAVLRTGLLVNIWYALGMPLLFAEHLLLHSAHVGITALATSSSTCSTILASPESQELFSTVWKSVHQFLSSLAGVAEYYADHEKDASGFEQPPYACEMLMVVGHVVVAFALPSLLLWRMEIASRQSYVQNLQQHGGMGRFYLDCTWLPDTCRIIVFGAVSTSACWVLFVSS